jgi:dTDP-4-amino-4,6-dideoxygalactose transaminase
VAANGVPVFCDVDELLSIDPAKIEDLVTPRTVAIAPTAVMGTVCDMTAIMKIARKHKLKVVEDCAQACGGRHGGRLVGTIGDMGCFSISAYKILGGGEGGLMLTNSKRLYERAQQIAECGGLWRPDRFGPERYKGELFCGTNYRMSELEAAVDVVQLKRVQATVKRFNTVKSRILKRLKTYKEIVPQLLNDAKGEVGYLLRFFPESIELGEKIVAALQAEGVDCGMKGRDAHPDWHLSSYMLPVTLKGSPTDAACPFECPHYTENGGSVEYSREDCPVAEDLYHRVVNVSLNQWMNAKDCRNVAAGINKVLSAYCAEDSNATPWLP